MADEARARSKAEIMKARCWVGSQGKLVGLTSWEVRRGLGGSPQCVYGIRALMSAAVRNPWAVRRSFSLGPTLGILESVISVRAKPDCRY